MGELAFAQGEFQGLVSPLLVCFAVDDLGRAKKVRDLGSGEGRGLGDRDGRHTDQRSQAHSLQHRRFGYGMRETVTWTTRMPVSSSCTPKISTWLPSSPASRS